MHEHILMLFLAGLIPFAIVISGWLGLFATVRRPGRLAVLLLAPVFFALELTALYLLLDYGAGIIPTFQFPYAVFGIAFALLLVALFAIMVARGNWPYFHTALRTNAAITFFYIAVAVGATLLVIYDQPRAGQALKWQDISGPKVFRSFIALDNYFQYVNGKAIAAREPFEKYYGNRQLVYEVQDREIGPGVLYSILLRITGDDTFILYTIFGIAMNALIVFPLFVYCRRWLGIRQILLFMVVAFGNAFCIPNIYFTWFKFCGVALFLSGIIFLLDDARGVKSWLKAGLCMGIATNMHMSAVLALPLLFIWLVARSLRSQGWQSGWRGPLVFIAVFMALNLPWTLVARFYFEPRPGLLVCEHFLNGHYTPQGFSISIRDFFASTPVADQFTHRLHSLATTFRLHELAGLLIMAARGNWSAALMRYSMLEWNMLAFVLYPSLAFICLHVCTLAVCSARKRSGGPAHAGMVAALTFPLQLPAVGARLWRVLRRRWADPTNMFLIALITMVLIILATFSHHPPDLTYHLPMAMVVIAHVTLVAWIWRMRGWLFNTYIIFFVLSIVRVLWTIHCD